MDRGLVKPKDVGAIMRSAWSRRSLFSGQVARAAMVTPVAPMGAKPPPGQVENEHQGDRGQRAGQDREDQSGIHRLRLHKPLTGRLPRRPRPVEDRMRFESLHETVDGNHRIPAAPFGALVEGYNTASGWQERDPPALETAKPSPLNRNDGFA